MARRMFKDTRKSRKVYLFPLKLPRETWHTAQQPMLYIKHPWQGKSKDEAGRKPPSTRAQNIPHLLLPTFCPLILESRTVRLEIHTQQPQQNSGKQGKVAKSLSWSVLRHSNRKAIQWTKQLSAVHHVLLILCQNPMNHTCPEYCLYHIGGDVNRART